MNKNFGTVLRLSREKNNLTREQLAKKVKVSAIYISHLENENPAAPISMTLLDRIKKAIKIEIGAVKLAERHNMKVRRYRNARKKAA